jgi:hypothetical protein
MSTQRYHFLTIVGRAGDDVVQTCEAILNRRKPDNANGFGGSDYSRAVDTRIERLCKSILAVADWLPVLHYATMVDGYGMGTHVLGNFPRMDGRQHAVHWLNYGIAFYPKSQAAGLLKDIAKARRRSTPGHQAYNTQYGHAIRIALEAGLFWKQPFVVVVITECLGASRLDADVQPSGEAGIPGVSRRRGRAKINRTYDKLGFSILMPIASKQPAKRRR